MAMVSSRCVAKKRRMVQGPFISILTFKVPHNKVSYIDKFNACSVLSPSCLVLVTQDFTVRRGLDSRVPSV